MSEPRIWWNRLTEPALVLGSTQRDKSIVDAVACAAAGTDVVRRRSGGGAVLLIPGEAVWFDVVLPTGPGTVMAELGDDVHAPMRWLGERIAGVLAPHVDGEVTVQASGMVSTPWSSLICFDGFGPGEVLLDGRKLVGISQRRTRAAARLQCCWYRSYDSAELVELLAATVRPVVDDLSPVATFDAPDEVVASVLSEIAGGVSGDAGQR